MTIRTPLMTVMVAAAQKAGRALRRDFGEVEQLQVSRKGPADFVSKADTKAEEIIYEELSKTFAKAVFCKVDVDENEVGLLTHGSSLPCWC